MWLVLLAASAYPAAPARAASACLPTECFSAKQVRTDLSFLYATMRDSHFNLYARVPQAAYDAYLASLLSEINGAIPKGQANLLMQRLLAFGRVGHARTDAPVNDALAFVHHGG